MKDFLKALLLPIARLALRSGFFLPELIDALKQALFEAAVQKLEERGEPVTASRVSVMTGLHRKDTSQFLKGKEPKRNTSSVSIKVIGAWQAKRKFQTPAGKPRMLSIGNEDSEFAKLVREVSADVHPRTILDELERLNLVAVNNSGVNLLRSSYISAFADSATGELLSRDTQDLLVAAEENVTADGSRPNHHTSTEYDNIPIEHAKEIRNWILDEAGAFHKKVREHIACYDRDLGGRSLGDQGKGTVRFVFCSFSRTQILEGPQP